MYLGENVMTTDLFGNTTMLGQKNGRSVLELTDWPQILSGVDSEITLLRSSVELDPAVLESSIFSQTTTLRFKNPFNTTIMGQVRFLLNSGMQENWLVDPQMFNYVLKPGQIFETDLKIKFPSSELAGNKMIDLGMRVDADRSYYINVGVPFEVEMKDIDVRVFARRVNQGDMMVQLIMTNNGDQQYSMITFIYYPDMDYDEKSARLEPGATITRSFVLRDAAKWIGRYVRVGLRDPKGDKSVNYQIKVQ